MSFFFFLHTSAKACGTLNCNDLYVFAFPLDCKLLKSVSTSYSHQVTQCPGLSKYSVIPWTDQKHKGVLMLGLDADQLLT